jgi:hypothetical protein
MLLYPQFSETSPAGARPLECCRNTEIGMQQTRPFRLSTVHLENPHYHRECKRFTFRNTNHKYLESDIFRQTHRLCLNQLSLRCHSIHANRLYQTHDLIMHVSNDCHTGLRPLKYCLANASFTITPLGSISFSGSLSPKPDHCVAPRSAAANSPAQSPAHGYTSPYMSIPPRAKLALDNVHPEVA